MGGTHHHEHGEHGEHGHGHDHHDHHHAAVPAGWDRAFALATALNLAFVVVEFALGVRAGSTALMADAGHNLSDVLGLLLAWGASALARRAPDDRYTYGLRSSSVLAALANAGLLLMACGAIAWEAILRLGSPSPVAAQTVAYVAAVGILVNGFSAWLFARGRHGDLNIRGAYLHMLADAAVSLGVVVAGWAIGATGWLWLDPAVSLLIVVFIVRGTWQLLRESLRLALQAVPPQVDIGGIRAYLSGLPGVAEVHDLHVWGMSTTESALTVHLVMPAGYPGDEFVDATARHLAAHHGIHHSTLQCEQGLVRHECTLARP
jgi:cobalt-zinc-cadmium efflux system protein